MEELFDNAPGQRFVHALRANGGYAEYLLTSARSVVKINDSLEPADVAALTDAGLTAYHTAAKAAKRLTLRDNCVVIGAGGLGHIGIQVLKALTPASSEINIIGNLVGSCNGRT